MKKSILFVDDEPNILHSFKRAFFDSGYDTYFATSAQEGLLLLSKTTVDLIVSDMRMPEMDGYAFLKIVREKYPAIIRIILSGYTDKLIIVKAVADGTAKAYLAKPWDNQQFKSTIARFFNVYDTLRQKKVMEIVNRFDRLPVLPRLYNSIVSLIQSDTDIDLIAKHIAHDTVFSSKLLTIVNSSLYGINIGSIKQAIVYLGLDAVKNILLSAELFEVYKAESQFSSYIDAIWEHSNLTSRIFHRLYHRRLGVRIPEEYAAIGSLHDIGWILMLQYQPLKFKKIFATSGTTPQRPLGEIESENIKISHSLLGGYLLDWWNLPYYLVEACVFHHNPLSDAVHDKRLMSLLHIADVLSWKVLRRKSESILHLAYESAGLEPQVIDEEINNITIEYHNKT